MRQTDVLVKGQDSRFYRAPVISGTYVHKHINKPDSLGFWLIRFDSDCPRLVLQRKTHPERPLDPLKVLAVSGVVGSLTKGRGKSEGYVSFTLDGNDHLPALGYELHIFKPIVPERIVSHLGVYSEEEVATLTDVKVVYRFD